MQRHTDERPGLRRVAAATLMTIEQLRAETDVGVLLSEADRAEAAAMMVEQYVRTAQEAEEARAELRRLSIFAQWSAGVRLSTLAGGKPGRPARGYKSPRSVAAADAGLTRQQVGRLVKLAGYDEEGLNDAISALQGSGSEPTVSKLLVRQGAERRRCVINVSQDVAEALAAAAEDEGVTRRALADYYLRMMLAIPEPK